jgi:hypothetical protein
MKTARATLSSAIMLMLSLLTSGALGAERDITEYSDSTNGFYPKSGILKFQSDCPEGTAFFKNVAPGLTNGGVAGSTVPPIQFIIDGKTVAVSISWDAENSFGFDITGGLAHIVAVTSDTNNLLYDYVNYYPPTPINLEKDPVPVYGPVVADGNLNAIQDAADVNHLDLCLAPLDTTPPVIEFISPLPEVPESGTTMSVIVEVTEESGLDPVTGSFNGNSFELPCEQLSDTKYRCSTTLSIADLPAGTYTITVTATDQAFPQSNSVTVSADVELLDFTSCFGTLGEEDFAQIPTETDEEGNLIYAGGCNPTGKVLIQAPPDNSACTGSDPAAGCYIDGTLLKPAIPTAHCGDYGFPDPRMTMIELPSPEYPVGRWVPTTKSSLNIFTDIGIDPAQEASVLAAVQASYPDPDPNDPDPLLPPPDLDNALVLDDKTYCANGCCVIAQHLKGNFLDELYLAWPDVNGLAFIKTHNARFLLGDDLAAKCYDYDPDGPPLPSFDLQDAASVGYMPLFQTPDDSGFLTVLTQDCRNPARDLTRNNGFDVSNIIVSTAVPRISVEEAPIEVLNFMYQQSEEDFVRVFFLLDVIERDALLKDGNFRRDVRSPMNQAKRRFDNFNTTSLQQSIDALADAADGIRTKTTYEVVEANPPGEALALIEHLIWELGLLKQELTRVEALP